MERQRRRRSALSQQKDAALLSRAMDPENSPTTRARRLARERQHRRRSVLSQQEDVDAKTRRMAAERQRRRRHRLSSQQEEPPLRRSTRQRQERRDEAPVLVQVEEPEAEVPPIVDGNIECWDVPLEANEHVKQQMVSFRKSISRYTKRH